MNSDAYAAFTPHPTLQPYVQSYAYINAGTDHYKISSIHIYPADHSEMSFILDEQHIFRERGTTIISGYPLCFVGMLDHGRCFDLFPKSLIQIVFKPYGAFKLFGIPQRYLSNLATDVSLMFPGIRVLTEQLREFSDSPAKVIALLENWLLNRLDTAVKIDVSSIAYACEQIRKNHGLLKVEDLCRNMGMSTTTLGDQFREKVGFSPKAFSRIVRFNQINKFIDEHRTVKWQELVYAFGFFDQNHFIKEFKRFYGCTPSQWHTGKSRDQ